MKLKLNKEFITSTSSHNAGKAWGVKTVVVLSLGCERVCLPKAWRCLSAGQIQTTMNDKKF